MNSEKTKQETNFFQFVIGKSPKSFTEMKVENNSQAREPAKNNGQQVST